DGAGLGVELDRAGDVLPQERGAVLGVGGAVAAVVGGDHLEGGLPLRGGGLARLRAVIEEEQLGRGRAGAGEGEPAAGARVHLLGLEIVGLAPEHNGVYGPRIVAAADAELG